MDALEIFGSPWLRPRVYFSRNCQWAFVAIDRIKVHTCTEFEVRIALPLPVPEIIGGAKKLWAVPRYASILVPIESAYATSH